MENVINVNREFAHLHKLHAEILTHEVAIDTLKRRIADDGLRLRDRLEYLLLQGHSFLDPFMDQLFPSFGIDYDKMLRVKVFNDELKKRQGQKVTLCFPRSENGANGPCIIWQFYFGLLSGEGMALNNDVSSPAFSGTFPFATYTEWRPGLNLHPTKKLKGPLILAEIKNLLNAIAHQTLNTTNIEPMLLWHDECTKEKFNKFGGHPIGQAGSGWQGFPFALKVLGVD